MSQVFLRRLRIGIAVLSFITGCLLAAYCVELNHVDDPIDDRYYDGGYFSLTMWPDWVSYAQIVFLIFILGSYVCSVVTSIRVHRFLRAFMFLFLGTTLLYLHLRDIMEVGVTLKNGPLEPRNAPKDVEIVSPLQPIQPQPYYQQQPCAYYPPQQPGQALEQHAFSTKYEAQGPVVMQQHYHPQQQQPYPNSYGAPPPQISGSMVTTAPQSDMQPVATPTSPGFSIAVSPAMQGEGPRRRLYVTRLFSPHSRLKTSGAETHAAI
ncbi:unnamed protein product [Mortierella alpina]